MSGNDSRLATKTRPMDESSARMVWSGLRLPKRVLNLPLKAFAGFSPDELCKFHHSSGIMMDETVTNLFEADAQYKIFRKIESSMWCWSCSNGTWNEVVDAYSNIRRFVFLEGSDFEIRLDYTTGYNHCGYSKHDRIFLDGVFGFFVYYKGKHVMTIGFSILSGRRLLIQQVQSAQRSGNGFFTNCRRIVWSLSSIRSEVTSLATRCMSLMATRSSKRLGDYQRALERNKEFCEHYVLFPSEASYLLTLKEDNAELKRRMTHLEMDRPRLVAFYRDTGAYRLGEEQLGSNGLTSPLGQQALRGHNLYPTIATQPTGWLFLSLQIGSNRFHDAKRPTVFLRASHLFFNFALKLN